MKKTIALAVGILLAGTAAAAVDCDVQAADVLARAGDTKQPILVPIKKALCVEAAKYPRLTIADSKTWIFEVAERDANQKAVTVTIRPLTKRNLTSAYLEDTEGHVHALFLTPVQTVNGQDVARDEHGNLLHRLSDVEWTPAKAK